METNKTTPKEKQKEPGKGSSKSLNGTNTQSNWEKAAELIAGNNQLMSTLLKALLSPLTLLAGLGLIIYLFFRNNQQKKEIEKLKEDNKKLSDEIHFITEEAESSDKKYKKLRKLFEAEQSQAENYLLPEAAQTSIHNTNRNKISYLR